MPTSPHEQSTIRPPHPLAVALAERLRAGPSGADRSARVLDYCSGSGRNAAFLRREGFSVVEVADRDAAAFDAAASCDPVRPGESFSGVVTSHGLLHGYASAMPARIARLANRLSCGGLLFATFGSQRDARFRKGTRLDDATFSSEDGDEPGVPHAYFDEAALRAILTPYFEIESLEERDATQTAGRWAHATTPLTDAVHWFVCASRRAR